MFIKISLFYGDHVGESGNFPCQSLCYLLKYLSDHLDESSNFQCLSLCLLQFICFMVTMLVKVATSHVKVCYLVTILMKVLTLRLFIKISLFFDDHVDESYNFPCLSLWLIVKISLFSGNHFGKIWIEVYVTYLNIFFSNFW